MKITSMCNYKITTVGDGALDVPFSFPFFIFNLFFVSSAQFFSLVFVQSDKILKFHPKKRYEFGANCFL